MDIEEKLNQAILIISNAATFFYASVFFPLTEESDRTKDEAYS